MHTEKTDKKDQIIHAALELFGKQGYEGTSIRDICQEANVNLAMVNYYFGSKEGLFAAMIERKASAIKDRLQELVNNETMTPQEKIDSVIEVNMKMMAAQVVALVSTVAAVRVPKAV